MKIYDLIRQLKDEAESLDPSYRDELLDMIDSFHNRVYTLLDPHANEPTGDEDKEADEANERHEEIEKAQHEPNTRD